MTLPLQLEQVQTDGSQSMAHRPRPAAADWALCDATARAHGKSFFLAGSLLPSDRRRAIRAAYAYCRISDDIIDRGTGKSTTEVLAELQAWENQIDTPVHPIARAFCCWRGTTFPRSRSITYSMGCAMTSPSVDTSTGKICVGTAIRWRELSD